MPPKLQLNTISDCLGLLKQKQHQQQIPSESPTAEVVAPEPKAKSLPKKKSQPQESSAEASASAPAPKKKQRKTSNTESAGDAEASRAVSDATPAYQWHELGQLVHDFGLQEDEAIQVMTDIAGPRPAAVAEPKSLPKKPKRLPKKKADELPPADPEPKGKRSRKTAEIKEPTPQAPEQVVEPLAPPAPAAPAAPAAPTEPATETELDATQQDRPKVVPPIDVEDSQDPVGFSRGDSQMSLGSNTTLVLGQEKIEKQMALKQLNPPAEPAAPEPAESELGPSASQAMPAGGEDLEKAELREAMASMKRQMAAMSRQLKEAKEKSGDAYPKHIIQQEIASGQFQGRGGQLSNRAWNAIEAAQAAKAASAARAQALAAPAPAPADAGKGDGDKTEDDGEECEEEEREHDPLVEPPSSVVPEPSRSEVAESGTLAIPEKINSSTHRAHYMRLSRLMDSSGPSLPSMSALWNGNSKERASLLRSWVENNEDSGLCEAELVMKKENEQELERGKDAMTVQDMLDAKFSVGKIESIIRRGDGMVDPDAPQDLESVQFWVTRKAKFNDKARASTSQTLRMQGNASSVIEGLSSGVAPGNVGALATPGGVDPAIAGVPGTAALLQMSREAATGASTGGADAKAKAKSKAKAKAKVKVLPQDKRTPAEIKDATRNQIKKEVNAGNSILLDLPQGDDLRSQLETANSRYQEILEKLLESNDAGEISDLSAKASTLVAATRLIKAQAQAVARELKKGHD